MGEIVKKQDHRRMFVDTLNELAENDPNIICIIPDVGFLYLDDPKNKFRVLNLGVTEAGLPSLGINKTRMALIPLLAMGIGETLRVSLTVPNNKKTREISVCNQIIRDVFEGTLTQDVFEKPQGLNLVSCPSCSRVENAEFVELAEKVAETSMFAKEYKISIAVMGCRVNGPGETYRADLGLWCGPTHVRLMRKDKLLGAFTYEEIIPHYLEELNHLIAEQKI